MRKIINLIPYFLSVILSLCTEEVEGRRKILRGRRTVTRHYRRGMPIPAWAIVLLMGIGYMIVGAAMYLIMRKIVLQAPIENVNSYTPAMMEDSISP